VRDRQGPSWLPAARRGVDLWHQAGARGIAQRLARAAYRRLDAAELEFPLDLDSVADSRALRLSTPSERPSRGRPLHVGFLSTPPGLYSGGHTTMFRMVAALEAAGHRCTLFLYDRYGTPASEHEAVIRRGWPWIRADVLDVADGLKAVDGCIATSWTTAHVLARRGTAPMRRLYLVQDFEPFFYPRGSEYALAEDTYRFGFRCLAVGHMVADLLSERAGVTAEVLEFGCDSDVYRLTNQAPRHGVVFYTKPHTPRRGYQLGALALREVHARRPDVPIHTVGDAGAQLPFPASNHGVCSPQKLADLYNRAVVGLAMSFTNVSLLAEELLACGTVPVINDSAYARADLESAQARWAAVTPSGIADQVLATLASPPDPAVVAASARPDAWRPAQRAFLAAVESEIYGA